MELSNGKVIIEKEILNVLKRDGEVTYILLDKIDEYINKRINKNPIF